MCSLYVQSLHPCPHACLHEQVSIYKSLSESNASYFITLAQMLEADAGGMVVNIDPSQ